MNFINCSAASSNELMRKTVIFWSENSAQHIESLVRAFGGTTAEFNAYFKQQLKLYYEKFKAVNESFTQENQPLMKYQEFLQTNNGFINLLERIKFEALSGYPVAQQTVFHYIYEQRYINAVFGAKNMVGSVLITSYFLPFLNQPLGCIYNQMYFWGIIGSMHPSFLMGNNDFYGAINGYAKEFLTGVCNGFNQNNFALSALKKPLKKANLVYPFEEFYRLNTEYLEFLKDIKQNSAKIFSFPSEVRLSKTFYGAVDHQISEHTLVLEICENIKKIL